MPEEGRQKYPMFQGEDGEKHQDVLDVLRELAKEMKRTVAQIVVRWTIQQAGITCALCGAKRSEQIKENTVVLTFELPDSQLDSFDRAIEEQGTMLS